jgi:hypothetical protein
MSLMSGEELNEYVISAVLPDTREMGEKYMADRYNPKMMLKSVASFYAENQLIIKDEYIWRENGLHAMTRPQVVQALKQASLTETRFNA